MSGRQLKIETLWAFIAVDDEGEGVTGYRVGDTFLPLIGADPERVESLRAMAQTVATASGERITLGPLYHPHRPRRHR